MRVSAVRGRQHIWLRLSKHLGGLLLAALLLHGSAAAADGEPRSVIEGLNAALLESMRNADRLGYAGRYQALEPVLRQSFDFPFMARLSIGRAWNDFAGGRAGAAGRAVRADEHRELRRALRRLLRRALRDPRAEPGPARCGRGRERDRAAGGRAGRAQLRAAGAARAAGRSSTSCSMASTASSRGSAPSSPRCSRAAACPSWSRRWSARSRSSPGKGEPRRAPASAPTRNSCAIADGAI